MKLKLLSLGFVFFSVAAVAGSNINIEEIPTSNSSLLSLKSTLGIPDGLLETSALSEETTENKVVAAEAVTTEAEVTNESSVALAEARFQEIYQGINYGNNAQPSYEVFRKGMVGYLNLLRNNKISKKGIITLIDFSMPSVEKRMWVIDLKNKTLLFHDLVAHGKNSGGNMADAFSNIPESFQSSIGFYVTAQTYFGKHGLSLRLSGMEAGYNDKAMERAIVMHGADYVNKDIIKSMGRLGRSFGCPAVSRAIAKDVITTIADRTVMFIYHPSQEYVGKSKLLTENEAITFLLAGNF